jgi:hypothetical protein
VDGTTPCEVSIVNDHMWHPGKRWDGTCRIEWADKVFYFSSFRLLRKPTSGSYSFVRGQAGQNIPSNAVRSEPKPAENGWDSNNGLPVCSGSSGWGKVLSGKCRFEWGDRVFEEPVWDWLVWNP